MAEQAGKIEGETVRGRILIVDDDTALSEMLGIVLRGEGFEPHSCDNGDQAFVAFTRRGQIWSCLI